MATLLLRMRGMLAAAIATYALASSAQVLLVAYLLTLQGDAPNVPGLDVVGRLVGEGRVALTVGLLIAVALAADFAADVAVVRIQGGIGPVVFDRLHGMLASHREAAALSRMLLVRRVIGRAVLTGARLGLPMRFLIRSVLSFSRAVMLVVAAVLVTDIPAVGLILVFGGLATVILVVGSLKMWTLPPGIAAARLRVRRSLAASMQALHAEQSAPLLDAPSGPTPQEAAAEARGDVGQLSAAIARRFAVLAHARLWVQVSIVIGIAIVGFAFPVSGLADLVSGDPASAAATILVIVLTVAAVAEAIRSGLKFARHLPTFHHLARIDEALARIPEAVAVRDRIQVILDERRALMDDEDEEQ